MTSAQRPPTVPAYLPWLGHGPALSRDPLGFMRQCQLRYGDVFSLKLPGGRRTFVLSPHDHPAFFKDKRLRFREVGTELGAKLFGYDAVQDGVDIGEMTHRTGRALMGAELQPLTLAMQQELQSLLDVPAPSGGVGLLAWLNTHLFGTGVNALFGRAFATPELLADFERFDDLIVARAAGVPGWLLPGYGKTRDRLAQQTARSCPHRSAVMCTRDETFDTADIAATQRQRMNLAWLWASQVNTIVSAFWTALHIARDARARRAVEAESRPLVGARDLAAEPLNKAELKSMTVLDSAIKEALRLTSSSIITRRATVDIEFPSTNGTTYRFDAGESVNLFSGITHFDPEIFEDPQTFRHDRFVGEGKGPEFFKDGRRVQFPMLPFGSGASMCPGRMFAINELKVVLAVLFGRFALRVDDPTLPPQDTSRLGLGILPPKHDIEVTIADAASSRAPSPDISRGSRRDR